MIQCTAVIYEDGSATLTIDGRRRKIRERNPQDARSSILTILSDAAATLKDEHALTVFESDDQYRFIVHTDGTLTDAEQRQDTPDVNPSQQPAEPDGFDLLSDTVTIEPAVAKDTEPPDEGTAPETTRKAFSISIDRTLLIRGMAILAAFLLLVSAFLAGTSLLHERRHTAALSACQTAAGNQQTASNTLAEDQRAAVPATRITSSQVSDSESIAALHQAAKTTDAIRATCTTDMSTDQLTALASRLDARAVALRGQSAKVREAANKVLASRDAKTLADAKASLAQTVKAAQGTLDSSHGKVADNKTREALQKILDTANKVLADKTIKDAKQYQNEQAPLNTAVKAVNESAAKKNADDQAAAQAAAAASQVQAQAGSSSDASSSSSSSKTKTNPKSRSSGSSSGGSSSVAHEPADGIDTRAPSWNIPNSGSKEGDIVDTDPSLK
jgi:hypothetical protein